MATGVETDVYRYEMASVINKLISLVIVFAIGLTGYGSSSLYIITEPQVLHDKTQQLNVTCSADHPGFSVNKVLTFEMIKQDLDQTIISIDNDQRLTKGYNFGDNMEKYGIINSNKSFLTLIVKNPEAKDAGIYTCLMFYLDENLQINNENVEGNVTFYTCPDGWAFYEGDKTCLKVFGSRLLNWYASRKECQKIGADLVQIRDDEKNTLVYDLAVKSGYIGHPWLGMRNAAMLDFDFRFVDGSPLGTYHPWRITQPSGDYQGDEKCVYMWKGQGYDKDWEDYYCFYTGPYVCSKSADPVSPAL